MTLWTNLGYCPSQAVVSAALCNAKSAGWAERTGEGRRGRQTFHLISFHCFIVKRRLKHVHGHEPKHAHQCTACTACSPLGLLGWLPCCQVPQQTKHPVTHITMNCEVFAWRGSPFPLYIYTVNIIIASPCLCLIQFLLVQCMYDDVGWKWASPLQKTSSHS